MSQPFYENLDSYFSSYSRAGIHEEMIKDEVRTKCYRDAIKKNPHLFKGKTVLDIGCGTGILSLFAAEAGAKQVFGIEMSSIAHISEKIIEANNYSHVITIINGKVEEIELPVESVDIIISEWMGYSLVFESMLETVIFARDKWLKPNGLIFPDIANMYICGIEDGYYKEEKIDWWDNVYGFNMECMKKLAIIEPVVDYVEAKFVTTTVSRFCRINLKTISLADLSKYSGKFLIKFRQNDYVHALLVFFDVEFSSCHTKTVLTTSPFTPYTHWKQTIFYLDDYIAGCEKEDISGEITITQNKNNKRYLDYNLKVDFKGEEHELHEDNMYYMC